MRNLHILQCFTPPRYALLVPAALLLAALPAAAQEKRPSLPDPVKFINKYDIVWNVVRAVLDDASYEIELADKKGGRITTRPYEFITGALTSSESDKIAIKKDSITGNWIRARYQVDALLEMISPTSTLVTVRTRMEGLNRELDGSEKWLPMESLGVIEKRLLGKISMKLIGSELDYDAKKGFWDKTPQPVDGRRPKPFTTRPPQ